MRRLGAEQMTDNTIARLADEVRSLLGSVLADTSESDLRYQRARADWWVRHRLRVLIEAADRVSKGPTATERDLRFVSELASTMAVIRPLVRLPMWLKIVHALTYEYNHAVIALHFAAAFESQGMRATLVDSAAHPMSGVR